MLGFIYLAVCLTTQMGYVGQTAVTPKCRRDGHVYDAAKGRTWALVNGVRVYSKTPGKEF
jgi:hypothetical protein